MAEHQYGQGSLAALKGVHPNLVSLFKEVLVEIDHTIIQGLRTKEEQDRLFKEGKSKLRGDDSGAKHVRGLAIDAAPYPVVFPENCKTQGERIKAYGRFYFFAGYVLAKAKEMGLRIRWGGDWDGDYDFSDQSFDDLVHFELLT